MKDKAIDLDDLKKFNSMLKNSKKVIIFGLLILVIVVFLFNSFYILKSGQVAVITRFGELNATETQAGVRFKIAFVDTVYKVDVAEVRRIEYGYTTVDVKNGEPKYDEQGQTTLMLTKDENLVNVEASIQYVISDAYKYLFKVKDPEETLKIISESTLRRGIASHTLDDVLTDNKSAIQQEIKEDLQNICDEYNLGIAITGVQLQDVNPPTPVEAAFKDVAGAREDKNSYINEANSYKNEKIPLARGKAKEAINQAEAYKQERIAQAYGEVAKFNEVYKRYIEGKEVTRTRLYLEVLESILPNVEKYILDEKNGSATTLIPIGNLIGSSSNSNNTNNGGVEK